jgi:hypothetical protein
MPSFSGDTNLPTKLPTQPTLAQDSKSAAEAQLSSSSSSISTKLIIAFVVVFFVICIFVLLCCCVRRHKKESSTKHILDTEQGRQASVVDVLSTPQHRSVMACRLLQVAENCLATREPLSNDMRARAAVFLRGLEPQLGVSLNRSNELRGARVLSAAGGAKSSGLLKNDLITACNGSSVSSPADFLRITRNFVAGDLLRVTVMRNMQEHTLDLRVGARTCSLEEVTLIRNALDNVTTMPRLTNVHLKRFLLQMLEPKLYGEIDKHNEKELSTLLQAVPCLADGSPKSSDHQVDELLRIYYSKNPAAKPIPLVASNHSSQNVASALLVPPTLHTMVLDSSLAPGTIANQYRGWSLANTVSTSPARSSSFLPRSNTAGEFMVQQIDIDKKPASLLAHLRPHLDMILEQNGRAPSVGRVLKHSSVYGCLISLHVFCLFVIYQLPTVHALLVCFDLFLFIFFLIVIII